MELTEIFSETQKIAVYKDGDLCEYSHGEQFDGILYAWGEMLSHSYEMPAFGVSLDSETKAEMKKGVWVEFYFQGVKSHDGMPFERLLVAVKQGYSGFNLVRYNSESGYGGRCFYINLTEGNMSNFYDILINL